MEIKERLEKILIGSPLDESEVTEFLELLGSMKKKDDQEEVISFLEGHPEWVLKLYRNYKIKQIYFSAKDEKGLQKIFKDEVKELQGIAKDEAKAN